MKVCLIVSQIFAYGKVGGFGSLSRLLGRGLLEAGVEVSAVVPLRKHQKPVEDLDGITVHGYPVRSLLFSGGLFRTIGADVYHSQEPSIATYIAMRAMPARKHIVTCQDPRTRHDWNVFRKYWTHSKRLTFPLSSVHLLC